MAQRVEALGLVLVLLGSVCVTAAAFLVSVGLGLLTAGMLTVGWGAAMAFAGYRLGEAAGEADQ